MFQEWLKDYEKFKKNNNMSEKEIIKICRILCGKKNKKGKREYPLFASLQLQEDYSKDEIAEAIESLLDLYQAEKEKNKKLERLENKIKMRIEQLESEFKEHEEKGLNGLIQKLDCGTRIEALKDLLKD